MYYCTVVPDEVLSCLNALGYQEFREGQKQAVLQILSGTLPYIIAVLLVLAYYMSGALVTCGVLLLYCFFLSCVNSFAI